MLVCLFLCLPSFSALAYDPASFQVIYRQENVVTDKWSNTRSDLMITVINLSGGEARDVVVSIPVPNPYIFVDSPIRVTTIPDGRQAEILHKSSMPNDLVALSEPEAKLVWRIEYTDKVGKRLAVTIPGVKGN